MTIGLAFLVAILQTAWYRTDNPVYKRMTRFFGTLLLINVAVGVVTRLVQEFEFGMNWSTYSRYVGGVFGAPLAMEGLAAFFLESTFLGLWLFGWDRLPKRVHLGTIWVVSIGTMLSARIIRSRTLDAESGRLQAEHGRPTGAEQCLGAVREPDVHVGEAHVILASLVTGSLVMLAVSAWYLRQQQPANALHRDAFYRTGAKIALIVLIPAIAIELSVGNKLGEVEGRYQPMKIAAAEALWNSCQPCSFSAAQTGGYSQSSENPHKIIPIPASVVGAGHGHLERSRHRAQSAPSPIQEEVRARELHS